MPELPPIPPDERHPTAADAAAEPAVHPEARTDSRTEAGPGAQPGAAPEADWPTDPRAVLARKRGLPGPAITGGQDPEPSTGRREERRYGSLLLLMVAVIVLAGFVLGIVGVLLGAGRP